METLTYDEHAELYADICDVIERNYHGWPLDDPADPLSHTSDEARAAANRIFEILSVPKPKPDSDWAPPPTDLPEDLHEIWYMSYHVHGGVADDFRQHLARLVDHPIRGLGSAT